MPQGEAGKRTDETLTLCLFRSGYPDRPAPAAKFKEK
jgi:hypothetical protein